MKNGDQVFLKLMGDGLMQNKGTFSDTTLKLIDFLFLLALEVYDWIFRCIVVDPMPRLSSQWFLFPLHRANFLYYKSMSSTIISHIMYSDMVEIN